MKILNDDLDFARAPQDVKDAFLGPPTKHVFRADDTIYRIVSIRDVEYRDGTKGGSPLFESAWWMPQETFHEITRRSYRTGRHVIPVARTGLAITREFNPHMDWALIVSIKVPVYGWVGRAAGQREFKDDAQVWLLGGLVQLWMPGLAAGGNGTSSPYAFIESFGAIEP